MPRGDLEGADQHAQLGPTVDRDQTGGAGVRAPRRAAPRRRSPGPRWTSGRRSPSRVGRSPPAGPPDSRLGQVAGHGRHQVPDPGMGLDLQQPASPRRCPARRPCDRSLRIRSVIMMFSAASLADDRSSEPSGSSLRLVVPLIGEVITRPSRDGEEPLRAETDQGGVAPVGRCAPYAGRVAPAVRTNSSRGSTEQLAGQPGAQVQLVDLTGPDPTDHPLDPGQVIVRGRRKPGDGGERPDRGSSPARRPRWHPTPALGGPRQGGPSPGESGRRRVLPTHQAETLEHPAAVAPPTQHRIAEGEPGRPRVVAQDGEPAATDPVRSLAPSSCGHSLQRPPAVRRIQSGHARRADRRR